MSNAAQINPIKHAEDNSRFTSYYKQLANIGVKTPDQIKAFTQLLKDLGDIIKSEANKGTVLSSDEISNETKFLRGAFEAKAALNSEALEDTTKANIDQLVEDINLEGIEKAKKTAPPNTKITKNLDFAAELLKNSTINENSSTAFWEARNILSDILSKNNPNLNKTRISTEAQVKLIAGAITESTDENGKLNKEAFNNQIENLINNAEFGLHEKTIEAVRIALVDSSVQADTGLRSQLLKNDKLLKRASNIKNCSQRINAEFTEELSDLGIKDLNSKLGTFLNKTLKEINNKDQIQDAIEKFMDGLSPRQQGHLHRAAAEEQSKRDAKSDNSWFDKLIDGNFEEAIGGIVNSIGGSAMGALFTYIATAFLPKPLRVLVSGSVLSMGSIGKMLSSVKSFFPDDTYEQLTSAVKEISIDKAKELKDIAKDKITEFSDSTKNAA